MIWEKIPPEIDILAVQMHAKHAFQLLKMRLQECTPF